MATGTVEFVPNLAATQRGLRLVLRLNNGEPGTYVVKYAYALGAATTDVGIFNTRYLPQFANVLFAGVFVDAEPVTVNSLTVPLHFGAIGTPLRIQAVCHGSTSGTTAYTNLVTTPGFSRPQGP